MRKNHLADKGIANLAAFQLKAIAGI